MIKINENLIFEKLEEIRQEYIAYNLPQAALAIAHIRTELKQIFLDAERI